MLKNVKSIYFIRNLFLYVDEYPKLKLVKYNKSLQKTLNINIINYIHFKGKYIIYKSKGKGKDYVGYRDKLLYEGDYINGQRNGKRNGKGKEYYCYSGKLKFECEYLNGRELIGTIYDKYNNKIPIDNTSGKGKEYNCYGNLIYEGEYLNGQRNGKGKEYDEYFGNLIYEGEYLNDKRNGKGKECMRGSLIFEGEYRYNKKWNGKGYDENGNLIYELINGNGIAKEYNEDNELLFEGEFLNGKRNGKGKEYDVLGRLIFEGEYLNGQRNGKGKEYYSNGELRFEGEYLYNKKIKGKCYRKGKLEFEGEFRYYKKWNGKSYDENGNIIYELINGNDKVKEYSNYNWLIFEGEYLNCLKSMKILIFLYLMMCVLMVINDIICKN